MNDFFSVITPYDVLFALIASFILTYLIKSLRINYKFVGIYREITINYDSQNIRAIVTSCCELFPVEIINFRGNTFRRGSNVEILINGNRKITGELIGANKDDMICLITSTHIIARRLSQVAAIKLLDTVSGVHENGGEQEE